MHALHGCEESTMLMTTMNRYLTEEKISMVIRRPNVAGKAFTTKGKK